MASDYQRVMMGDPWFVGLYYLTIRKWEPMFNMEIESNTTTTIWAKLPQLPLDFYDPITLDNIAKSIGKPLRIDAHTATSARAQYARLCIQVNLDRPLTKQVRVSKHVQKVEYEGVFSLCFDCGCIGHRAKQCRFKEKANPSTDIPAAAIPNFNVVLEYGTRMIAGKKSEIEEETTRGQKSESVCAAGKRTGSGGRKSELNGNGKSSDRSGQRHGH